MTFSFSIHGHKWMILIRNLIFMLHVHSQRLYDSNRSYTSMEVDIDWPSSHAFNRNHSRVPPSVSWLLCL